MTDLYGVSEGVIGKILAVVVVLAIVGGTIALVFTNLATVMAAFASPSTGNTTLNAIIPVLGLVLGIAVIFGIVGVITLAFRNHD